MLFKVEVELDWVEGDNSIDDEVRSQIVSEVARQVRTNINETTKKEIQSRVSDKVDEWILEQLSLFCDRQIRITDKWGDTQETHESVTEMFKSKFDEFFNASVDKDGKALSACAYGHRTTRIDYLLNKMAQDYLKEVTDDMDNRVKRAINAETKAKIEEKIKKGILDKVGKFVV